jgi:protease I
MSENISLLKALLKVEASPSAPRLSSAQLLDAPANKAIQDIWALPPDNPRLHAGSKIAVLATDGVEEIEINSVLHYFRSRGAQVDLVAPRLPRYSTALGIQFPAIRETHIMTITYVATGGWIKFDRLLEEAAGDDYDAVIVPGGAWNPDAACRSEGDQLRPKRRVGGQDSCRDLPRPLGHLRRRSDTRQARHRLVGHPA